MKIKLLGLAFALLISQYALADDCSLSLNVKGVKNDKGYVYVELYNEPKTFRQSAKALSITKTTAAEGVINVKFDGLKPGHYAVLAYHDEDGNGILNKRFGMIPLEGYALSNDPEVIGPPSFESSDFEVLGDAEINVTMRY